jgi:hypothetical protein
MPITISGAASLTYADPIDAHLYAAGKYWESERASASNYSILEIEGAGVDGTIAKRFGFRGRQIAISVVYVAASSADCAKNFNDDMDTLRNKTLNLALYCGSTFPACELVGATAEGFPKNSGHSTYYMGAVLVFNQRRLA